MPKFKAIFWDNDGTLVDTEKIYFKSTKKALKEAGFALTKRFYIDGHLGENLSIFQPMIDANCSRQHISEVRNLRNKYYAEMLKKGVKVRPGVKKILKKLSSEDTYMAVVTSSPRNHFRIVMDKTGFSSYFKFYITKDDVASLKPDPEPYLQALHKSGFKPEECLAIEDTPKGIESAKKAGLTAYAVPTKMTKDMDFSMANGVFKSVTEIFLPASTSASTESSS